MEDLYTYTDYRVYLKDYFAAQKMKNKHFSHQVFAQKAGISSSGFVLHVMKGQRNLTKPVLLKIARALGLDAQQMEYFEDLVSFDQAKSRSDKEYYFNRIVAARRSLRISTLEDKQYEFYSQWYHCVIRELVTMTSADDSLEALAKLLVPAVTPTQVRKSLKLQEELGILRKQGNGTYVQTDQFFEAGGPVRNLALINYQKEMLKQALQAWDRFNSSEIMMNTVTLSMPEDMVETVKTEIRNFRRKLFNMISQEKIKANRVFNFTMNVFPATRIIKEQYNETKK